MDVQHTGPIQGLSGCTTSAESRPGRIGPICPEAKQTGERSARKSACCVRRGGAGNVAWSRWCDTRRRKSEPTGNTNFDLNRRASPRPYLCDREAVRFGHWWICHLAPEIAANKTTSDMV